MQQSPQVKAQVVGQAAATPHLFEEARDPFTIVIFGATGDLAARKLLPALFNLMVEGALTDQFSVVGFARRPWSDDDFRKAARQAIGEYSRVQSVQDDDWARFAGKLSYHQGTFEDGAAYQSLRTRLDALTQANGSGKNRIFYLAVSPQESPSIVRQLRAAGLTEEQRPETWARVVMEKPFGHDLASARALNKLVNSAFAEDQVYRIDHYLGKETVQNILALRLANGIFEPIWNRRYVDFVQITVAETVGVEHRAAYYEESGALRDIVQNHMLQLLSLTAMEPPITFDANAIHNEKVKVLNAAMLNHGEPLDKLIVRAQYTAGTAEGQSVPGYRQEDGVSPSSNTETYVALQLYLDTWRWSGVPFLLRTGKRMAKRTSEIAIQFKCPPLMLFKSSGAHDPEPNVLVLRIQPDEGIDLHFGAKMPGGRMRIAPVLMDFTYSTAFATPSPEAYERLIFDCVLGDTTLFARRDEVEASWALIQPILDHWAEEGSRNLLSYQAGSWGPPAADELMSRHD
ncbi:MAG TPA: glucose-6-phosphate dehydrogenase, partial [Ktedonobacterales bacterium]|nr:glucose-6-phosphate dehydrogenase [Ktedonobacterales bacterium]